MSESIVNRFVGRMALKYSSHDIVTHNRDDLHNDLRANRLTDDLCVNDLSSMAPTTNEAQENDVPS